MKPTARRLAALFCLLLIEPACERRTPTSAAAPSDGAQDGYRQPARLVAALGLRPGDAVAEIGAGGGYLTGRLALAVGPNGRVLATDIDESALAALRRRTAGLHQVETRQVPADQSGLGADTFDLILLAQVDHLLADRAAYLRALRPALRAGGRVAVSNGERHRQAVVQAGLTAGFHVETVAVGLPAQFLIVLRP